MSPLGPYTSPAPPVPPTVRQPGAPAFKRPGAGWHDDGAGIWTFANIGHRPVYCCQSCGRHGFGSGHAAMPATFAALHEPTCPLTADARAALEAVAGQEAPPSEPTLRAGVAAGDDAVAYDYAAPWRALEAAEQAVLAPRTEAVLTERRRIRDWSTETLVAELLRRGMRLRWDGPVVMLDEGDKTAA